MALAARCHSPYDPCVVTTIESRLPFGRRIRQAGNPPGPAVESIRLMVLHSHVLFRTSLARLLATEAGIELVSECVNTTEALEDLVKSETEIVLFDFAIWQEFVCAAREAGYQGKFLAIAEEIDPSACARALRQRVSGVFLASDSALSLVQAIDVVMRGGVWVNQSVIQLLADRYPYHEDLQLNALAAREQSVLRGILSGLSNRKIADQIGVSESTVKATLQQLFKKTGVRTRSQLVRISLADAGFQAPQPEKSFD